MTVKAYWYPETHIWIVEHAGKLTFSDLLVAAAQTRRIMHIQPLLILVDMTEVMYTNSLLVNAVRIRRFDAFITPRNISVMAFVIPGTDDNPLHSEVRRHQSAHQRQRHTLYYDNRDDALSFLIEQWEIVDEARWDSQTGT